MEKMLVSPSPQIRDNISTSKVMTHVLVALCPALAMSAYVFGGRALMLIRLLHDNGTHMGKALQSYNEKT